MSRTRQLMIVALACVTVAIVLGWPVHMTGADAPRLAPGRDLGLTQTLPAHCAEHVPLDGGLDYVGDYHCGGLAVSYHVDGVGQSPYPIWAGQWLFADQGGVLRKGWCTFNRGIHPTIGSAASLVAQSFPNDPTGLKRAYLTWRYGDTSDDLTAAGLWAVFHYYAQDAAGANRASKASSPLVGSLDLVAAASGRPDIATRAIELDAEAKLYAEPLAIEVELTADGTGEAQVLAGSAAVGSVAVVLTLDGATFDDGAATRSVITDASGGARFHVEGADDAVAGVTAVVDAPSPAQVYRGVPADPSAMYAQTLLTSGGTTRLVARTTMALLTPSTTSPAAGAPTTTTSATTTSAAPIETLPPAPSTDPAATLVMTPADVTSVAPPPAAVPETSPALPASAPIESDVPHRLPTTGRTAIGISYWATTFVVAGVGIVGAIRRRRVSRR